MISDCLDGQVDLILTKSISRFARNTVDTVTTIRKLKEKGVAVYFEKKDFYTVKMPINAVNTALSKGSWCLVPVAFRMVLICCTKFSCLLELVVQKSCRL